MNVQSFFDKRTSTFSYVVYDPIALDAVVIDPVLDFDPTSGRIFNESLQKLEQFLKESRLKTHWILETHVHADHLSGALELKKKIQAPIAISQNVIEVQKTFQPVFNLSEDFRADGSQFDHLLKHHEILSAGSFQIQVRHTPGHTPACTAFYIQNVGIFTGDTLFVPERGCGRCDFPGGSAQALYRSIQNEIYSLPDDTIIYVGHDYPGKDEIPQCQTTVGDSKARNIYLKAKTTEEEFILAREKRDQALAFPALLYPSLQVNIQAGQLPPFLKLPIKIDFL